MRYELWREQNWRCLYTDEPIHPRSVAASDNLVQVDHILPWSRSGDDSFVNKTLCFAKANQDKRGRTPSEWFRQDKSDADWDGFVKRVETNKMMKGRKKRNYLLKDATLLEGKFLQRNLNDTRYACRVLADLVARLYPADGARHVRTRPGPLTDRLRRGWGIQDLKKTATGKRLEDDRHHALDALVVAATSESALQRLTRAFQEAERIGSHRDFANLDPPWPGFVAEAREKLSRVFVSRAERRRARGEAHGATIRQIGYRDGSEVVYERKKIEALTATDLARIKDPERNARLVKSLAEWIEAGKPKDGRPLSPKGDPIVKIRLRSDSRPGVRVFRGQTETPGSADRSRIVRVDVFESKVIRRRSKYLFVPIYAHQVIESKPPSRAFTLRRDYESWSALSDDAMFIFSLYPMCFVEATYKERGYDSAKKYAGYFRGIDANDGRITLSDHRSKDSKAKSLQSRISPTTLLELKKIQVDRLGRRFEIQRETRTWHGVACT